MNSVSRVSTLLFGMLLLVIPILSSARSFKNCAELHESGQTISGVYTIKPDRSDAFDVYCDQTTDDGGWTVFQRRIDGSVDFNRTWANYTNGFGSFLTGEFWLGLDKIYRLTQEKNSKLRVDLRTNSSQDVYAEYEWFGIGNKMAKYRLNIGKSTKGTLKDSLSAHNSSRFSTWDQKHHHCTNKGGESWWFEKRCSVSSNLNGIYGYNEVGRLHWGDIDNKPEGAPKTSAMKIRPQTYSSRLSE